MKSYNNEREGQIDFFSTFRIDYKSNEVLIDNTDGVWKGNLLEFKLVINNVSKVLFQAIKYLSKLRIKGASIPANILLISLNEEICYVFNSQDYFEEIHKIYWGPASKNNDVFISKSDCSIKIDLSTQIGQATIIELLRRKKYMPISIDENCIVGWAERYYRENPKANKGDFLGDLEGKVKIIGEIRKPKHFKDLIIPYRQKTNEKFKYLMDKLNDNMKKKDLGAFYTPIIYCKKAAELIKIAISNVPKGNDYIILDRCAGTGNLESVLNNEELEHCILSTYEYYEYKVLCERLYDKVRHIIPPTETEATYDRGFVRSANALSKEYIENQIIQRYLKDKNCTVILFENPPYAEANGTTKISSQWKKSYVAQEMKKEIKGTALNDLSNAFIWSAFKYYLREETDSYIVFSPPKYWKYQHLINKSFRKGFAFNRRHFHTKIDACIMVALWENRDDNEVKQLKLEGYDICDGKLHNEDIIYINKVYEPFSNKYYDKRAESTDEKGVAVELNGKEVICLDKIRVKPIYNKNIIGYLVANSTGFDNPDLNSGLTVAGRYDGNGFFLRKDNYLEKLPMFAASRYITYNRHWTERARIMKSADGVLKFYADIKKETIKQMLLKILLFTTLENQNHIRSFNGSDNRVYLNELCLDTTNGETLASNELKGLSLSEAERNMIKLWDKILDESKSTSNYNKDFTYGIYQIQDELNTYHKNDNNEKIYDYPILNGYIVTLKKLIREYYLREIVPFLFKYEFLK